MAFGLMSPMKPASTEGEGWEWTGGNCVHRCMTGEGCDFLCVLVVVDLKQPRQP